MGNDKASQSRLITGCLFVYCSMKEDNDNAFYSGVLVATREILLSGWTGAGQKVLEMFTVYDGDATSFYQVTEAGKLVAQMPNREDAKREYDKLS